MLRVREVLNRLHLGAVLTPSPETFRLPQKAVTVQSRELMERIGWEMKIFSDRNIQPYKISSAGNKPFK